MKPRTLISLALLAMPLAAGSTACTAETQQQTAADEPTSTAEAAQLIATTPIMIWPAGPIAWTGLNGVWPIAVWSPAAITGLAFGLTGATNFAVTNAALMSTAISSAWLGAFVPPVATTGLLGAPGLLGSAGFIAPAFGFTGTFAPFATAGFGLGTFGAGFGLQGAFLNGGFMPWSTILTPTLTSSALMFTNIAAMTAVTPLMFNVAFTAQSAATATAIASQAAFMNTASLSIFATNAALATTIPFTSIAFPIMPFVGAGFGTLGAGFGAGFGAGLGLGAGFNNLAIPGPI
jgi:hypothetical protein